MLQKSRYFITEDFEIRSLPPIDEDPFAECDSELESNEDSELVGLISQVQLEDGCSVEELICGEFEDSVPICTELTDEAWKESFFADLGPASKRSNDDEDDIDADVSEDDNNSEEDEPVPAKVKTYSDAIESLEEVLKFLEDKGHTDEATSVNSLISLVVKKSYVASASAKQTLITEYF